MANEKRLIDANDAEQVKKALAMCYKQGLTSECDGCVYKANKNICIDALMEDALALINSLESCIDAQPTVEVVHGRWIPTGDWNDSTCSCCNHRYISMFASWWGYCPNCGEKMDGGNENVE